MARGTLRTIGATTWAEYRNYFEKDPALTRRFQPISVDEPSIETACYMIRGLRAPMQAHHKVRISDAALEAAVKLSARYLPARQLPDKAVSLLDTACARVAISQSTIPARIADLRAEISGYDSEIAARDPIAIWVRATRPGWPRPAHAPKRRGPSWLIWKLPMPMRNRLSGRYCLCANRLPNAQAKISTKRRSVPN
ncbi:hypothetical protein ACFSS8_15595 [Paracoccus kondratievae]